MGHVLIFCAVVVWALYWIIIGIFEAADLLIQWIRRKRQRLYYKYYTKRKYDQTLLGKIEKTLQQILNKKGEINTAIEKLRSDIKRHKEHIELLSQQLKKDQVVYIAEEIEKQIALQSERKSVLEKYVLLFSKCLVPITKEENGMATLFEIVKFNQQNQDLERYTQRYEDLTEKIKFFSKYDFVDMSQDILYDLDCSIETINVGTAKRHIKAVEEDSLMDILSKDEFSISENVDLVKTQGLEQLLARNFEESIADFELIQKDFKKVFRN